MTIRTWLVILALAVGAGTSPSIENNAACPPTRVCRINNNCWINGVWYNPCPSEAPPSDPKPPEILPPTV